MNSPDQREAVFARIREALQLSAPAPGAHGPHGGHAAKTEGFRQWLPPVGPTVDEQVALFASNSVELKTEFIPCPSVEQAGERLSQLARENNWNQLASHRTELNEAVTRNLSIPIFWLEPGYNVHTLESCAAGLTGCEALIAQTGSILVSAPSAGGRTLSVLPPHHLVVARRSQMLPDLTAAYEFVAQKYKGNYPSFMSFITGPSRTGDIERILVLGAHGPKRLTVLLVDN